MKKKVIAFIPARGGSKGIPGKNIKYFCGKPLIYWSLKAARECETIDKIVVATDSNEIEKVINDFKFDKVVIYRRLDENARDGSTTESVMLEFIENSKDPLEDEDIFVLIQTTNPFLDENSLTKALDIYKKYEKFESILSVVEVDGFFWQVNNSAFKAVNYNTQKRPRRQDQTNKLIKENGSFYINRVENIIKFKNRIKEPFCGYHMPWFSAFELDTPDDWDLCEFLFKKYMLKTITKIKKNIKLFLTDVDGTLTDAGMYYNNNGECMKKFDTRDGKAFELLRNVGIQTGILTGEISDFVEQRADKLKIDYCLQGVVTKYILVCKLCEQIKIDLAEVAYIGDDLNDFELLFKVGLAATPADGIDKIKEIPGIIVLDSKGGQGAVREFVEKYIL